jgi:ABC-type Na+ efflux pump permease subunit
MMFIVIYGNMVMRSVIEEKTSRIIEVIISSVKPFQLMMGKIIGTSLAGILQFLIWAFSEYDSHVYNVICFWNSNGCIIGLISARITRSNANSTKSYGRSKFKSILKNCGTCPLQP